MSSNTISADIGKISFAKITSTNSQTEHKSAAILVATPQHDSHQVTASTSNGTHNHVSNVAMIQSVKSPKGLEGQQQQQQEEEQDTGAKSGVQFMAIGPLMDSSKSVSTLDSVSLSTADDVGTLISSLNGKPPSIGSKSIASQATFAMDEKESLRPDDSASIAAATEDEDLPQSRATGAVDSTTDSNEDVRAFREQLNEISAIDPLRRSTLTGVNQDGAPTQGVLYVAEPAPLPGLLERQATSDLFEALPDLKLVEALENPRDRIWVLKLEQDVIDFVKDAKESSLILPQCNSFYRMLAHKIADYYMLGHSVDDSNSAVRLFKTPTCRIPRPLTGVITPSTAASTPPPPSLQMKILRRGIDASGPVLANGSNMPSKSASETGESCNDDDLRKLVTREEREARYEAARLRIMGSAKPVETVEVEKDESRSSSVSGRKGRKGRRENSNDDFEARSAYASYFTPSQGSAYQPPFLQTAQQAQSHGQFAQSYGHMPGPAYAAYPQTSNGQYWYPPAMQESDAHSSWPQSPPGYDLAREFDQSMSFQQPSASTYSAPHSPYGQTTFQQSYSPYGWSQSAPPVNGHPMPNAYAQQSYNDRPSSSASQPQQSYAYGQLPSQALGRPPNALEHPLPGSYKSRHFNPQSQSFIPGPSNTNLFRPYLPPRTMSGPSASIPGSTGLERQMSSQSQGSQLGSPGQPPHGSITSRIPPHSLTHPLPQPVFATQVAPAVSLPPKPIAAQRMAFEASGTGSAGGNTIQAGESTIAKWSTPASLPSKPPPAIEKHDTGKAMQRSVQTGYTMPSFGSMPAGGGI